MFQLKTLCKATIRSCKVCACTTFFFGLPINAAVAEGRFTPPTVFFAAEDVDGISQALSEVAVERDGQQREYICGYIPDGCGPTDIVWELLDFRPINIVLKIQNSSIESVSVISDSGEQRGKHANFKSEGAEIGFEENLQLTTTEETCEPDREYRELKIRVGDMDIYMELSTIYFKCDGGPVRFEENGQIISGENSVISNSNTSISTIFNSNRNLP